MQFETLQKDMIAAMKAHDKPRKEAISVLVSAAKAIAIDEGTRDNISEDIVNRAVLKEQRAAKEQLDECPDDREDLKKQYQFRYDVISEYAPKMMDKEEIRKVLTEQYADVIATKNVGQIMKTVMPALKGKADGSLIKETVNELIKEA